MRFDGPTLAHAWLATYAAASPDKNQGTLYKTIAIHEHLRGIRLVATNRQLVLTAYVPDLEHHYDSPPDLETDPEHTHVCSDHDGRARGLFGYVCALAGRIPADDYAPGQLEVRLDFGQRLPGGDRSGQASLEGMEPTYTAITVPDREKVHLEIVATTYPDVRPGIARWKPTRTTGIQVNPVTIEILAKARTHAGGGKLELQLGEHTALVNYPNSDPHIHGLLVLEDPSDPDVYQPLPDDVDEPELDAQAAATIAAAADPAQTTIDDQIADAVTEPAARHLRSVDDNDLLEQAARLTVSTQLGSAAQLKRVLKIGQTRAARLMDQLEEAGIVGPADADTGRARSVLLKADQVDQAIAATRGHQA